MSVGLSADCDCSQGNTQGNETALSYMKVTLMGLGSSCSHYLYAHAHPYTRIHTQCAHTRTHTQNKHTHKHAHTRTHTHTHAHMHIHTYTLTQPPPQPHQGIPGQTGGRQVLIPTPTPPHQVMYPQPVPTAGQVGVRPPMYPHLAAGVLPPNLPQQLLFQQMQGYGQMQQPAPTYGGVPPQSINLQLQQPTMQMQPLPVQQSYTRKPRDKAIRIINPDTGNEVKVDSGSGEAPQVPTPPVAVTPALMTSSVGAPSTESSFGSTRSGAEEFRRKVAQAANSEPRPPPPPNAIIRDPNHPKQMAGTRQELTSSDTQPVQPVAEESSKLPPLEPEKADLEPPSEATITVPAPTPTPPLAPVPASTPTLTPAHTLTPTHVDTPVGGGPGNLDNTGIVVSQEEKQPPPSEVVDSVKDDSSKPSEALQPDRERESAQMQEKAEEEEKTKHPEETKLSEESKKVVDSTLVTAGPSPLVPEAVESATGEKSTQEVEVERPVTPVQQERPVSIPVEADLQPPHPPSENILEPSELPNLSSLPEFTSGAPPVLSTEESPVTGTKPDIPPTTEDKRSSPEPVAAEVASDTETLTDKPTSETADSGAQSEQKGPTVEGVIGQEIQPQSEAVVPPKPSRQDIEEQSSAPFLPESSRTEVRTEAQSSELVIEEEADSVGRTELPEEQEQQEGRTEVVAPAEAVPEVRMRDEKTGESLAAVSEKGVLTMCLSIVK